MPYFLLFRRIFSFIFFICIACIGTAQVAAQTLTESNLAIVVINTDGGQTIPDEPGILADMAIYDKPGSLVTNNITTDTPVYTGKIDIETRGNSSQFFPKKSFGFETKDATGQEDIDVSIFGMPAEEDWILNAFYADKTFMRDVLAHHIARQMGMYSSRTKFVEVILNGEYQGVYVAMEKIKRGGDRVDIGKLNPDEISGSDLTGGYILKFDSNQDGAEPEWTSPFPALGETGYNPKILIDYPKASDLQPEQYTYIKDFVTEFETALAGPNFKDPAVGYRKYLDVGYAVDYYLVQEVMKNIDAWKVSTYFFKEKSTKKNKIKFGPAWDYDRSSGNIQFCYRNTVLPTGSWTWEYNLQCTDRDPIRLPLSVFWPQRLLEDDYFVRQLRSRYQTLRLSTLRTDSLLAFIDRNVARLNAGPQQRNFEKWPILTEEIFYNEVYGNESYAGEVADLKSWLTEHLIWMDEQLGVADQADLSLAMQVSSRVVPQNTPVEVTLTVTNDGPQLSSASTLQNRLPPNVSFVNTTNPAVTASKGIVTIQTSNLPAGSNQTFAYFIRPTAPGRYSNAVQVLTAGQPDPDSQPGSGTGDGQDDAAHADFRTQQTSAAMFASPNPNQAPLPPVRSNQPAPDSDHVDLELSTVLASRVIGADNLVRMSLVVGNAGGLNATGIVVQIELPDGSTVLPGSGLSQSGNLATLTLPDLPAGQQISQAVQIQLSAATTGGHIRSQISQCVQPDVDSTPNNGLDNGEDDEARADWRR